MIEKQEKLLFLVSEKRVLVRDRNMCGNIWHSLKRQPGLDLQTFGVSENGLYP